MRMLRNIWKNLFYIWILLEIDKMTAEDIFHPTAQVFGISPKDISNMGGVITISGKNFAYDNFNQFEANLGNKVFNLLYTRKCPLRGHILAPPERLSALELPGVNPGGRPQESGGDSNVI